MESSYQIYEDKDVAVSFVCFATLGLIRYVIRVPYHLLYDTPCTQRASK